VEHQHALSEEEMLLLFSARGADFDAVCRAADELRRRVNGDAVTYVVNRNIQYTNICTYKYVMGTEQPLVAPLGSACRCAKW
jgi:FO synthase